jgi:NADH-quinone oxidoreductase subunit C
MSHLPAIAPHDSVAKRAQALFGAHILEVREAVGELTLLVTRNSIAEVLTLLRDAPDLAFEQLMDICGADFPERAERFEVIYHLLSLRHNFRVRVKLLTDEVAPVPSVVSVFPVAGWLERETWDCYGVFFEGNPDLRRILTDYGFEGHPFRKDFPLTGHVELHYSEEAQKVVYAPVKLKQDFRDFDFLSPWEGMLPGDEKATPQQPGGAAAVERAK